MLFSIPPELEQVECHLMWMGEVIPYLERSVADKCETLEEHIRFLLDKRIDDEENDGDVATVIDETFKENYNVHNPKYVSVFASRLNEAAKLAYLSSFEEAKQKLELLERIYDKLESCHQEACKYAVDTMKWSIKVLKNYHELVNSSESEEVEPEAFEDVVLFQKRWEELQENDKAKAILRYLWATLGGGLKMSEECILPILQEVLRLDPDYHVWYSIIYRSMRGIRRNVLRNQSGRLEVPSEEERLMCQEAFERQPNIYLSIKDMAIMLKENLWNDDEAAWERDEDTYLHCQFLFEEALQIAMKLNQRKWTRKIQVYLAEFLLFGRGSKLDQTEGKRLFDKCLEENPKDTTVLHKVGKLCHYGAAAKSPDYIRTYKNFALAEQFYHVALNVRPGNFPCLKDYLKILAAQKSYAKYLETCNNVIDELKRDYQVSDLKIACGCVIWIFNPFESQHNREEACENWLYVISKLPDCADKVYSTLQKPPFSLGRNRPAYVNSRQVFNTLERMRKTCSKSDKEMLNAIRVFSEAVQATSENAETAKPFLRK